MGVKKELVVGAILPPLQLLQGGQFYSRDRHTYCLRPSCDGCQYDPGCRREEMTLSIGPGVNIRQAFRARAGWKWASIDFSGIELRLAAQESREPVWLEAFRNDRDLHREMAKVMFKKDDPTDKERKIAKIGNFGNLYLASIATFHKLTDLTYNEAAIAWKKWWAAIPVYAQFVEEQKRKYRAQGYTKTFFGRKREMRAMIAKAMESEQSGKRGGKKVGWGFCDRTSVNTLFQGASADLIKIAMTRVTSWLEKEKLEGDVKMMLTVHDELDFEIREQPGYYEILREIGRQMTLTPKGAVLPEIKGFVVPLRVEIEVGDNWGAMAKLDDLDPEGVDPPPTTLGIGSRVRKDRDEVILLINSLRPEDAPRLHLAVFKAANQEGVVKVPLKFQVEGQAFQSKTLAKVASDFLKKEIENIPGIVFRS